MVWGSPGGSEQFVGGDGRRYGGRYGGTGKMHVCSLAWFGGSTSKTLGVNSLLMEQGLGFAI